MNTNKLNNENALQNATVNSPATFTFKSAKLNAYSEQIAAIGRDMASKNVELAVILGKIKTEKAYAEDGFKSVSDYAEQTFGIKKSQAYQLANVGERFYNSDTATSKKVVNLLTPANMAEIANMSDEEIDKAIESGAISKDTTQKQLRETAKQSKGTPKVVVDKMHDIRAVIVDPSKGGFVNRSFERMTIPAFEHIILSGEYGFENAVSKKFDGDSKSGTMVVISTNGSFAKLDYTTPSPAKTTKKPKYTKAQLEAMLADLMNEESEAEDKDVEG